MRLEPGPLCVLYSYDDLIYVICFLSWVDTLIFFFFGGDQN